MTAATRKASERAPMTDMEKKRAESARRKESGQVEMALWLSASDHAALTQMARDSGMTQAQVVSRLIGMAREVKRLDRYVTHQQGMLPHMGGQWVRHSDLTAAVGL